MRKGEWKRQITSRYYYENNFHPPDPVKGSRGPPGLTERTENHRSESRLPQWGGGGGVYNHMDSWNSTMVPFISKDWMEIYQKSTVIASGRRDNGQFFSLYLPVFSIAYMYFFYGQKQHFIFEERLRRSWRTRALRNKLDGKKVILNH